MLLSGKMLFASLVQGMFRRTRRRRGQRFASRPAMVQMVQLESRQLLSGSALQVQTVDRVDPQNVLTDTARFEVTFSANVTGVDATDFQLAKTGTVTTDPAFSVSPISGSKYLVTVTGIAGHGTLRLDVVNNGSIQDGGSQALWTPESVQRGLLMTSLRA